MHVNMMMSEGIMQLPPETDGMEAEESMSMPPKCNKTDRQSASQKFLATTTAMLLCTESDQ